jgi:hypothetical protein
VAFLDFDPSFTRRTTPKTTPHWRIGVRKNHKPLISVRSVKKAE